MTDESIPAWMRAQTHRIRREEQREREKTQFCCPSEEKAIRKKWKKEKARDNASYYPQSVALSIKRLKSGVRERTVLICKFFYSQGIAIDIYRQLSNKRSVWFLRFNQKTCWREKNKRVVFVILSHFFLANTMKEKDSTTTHTMFIHVFF